MNWSKKVYATKCVFNGTNSSHLYGFDEGAEIRFY